MFTIELINDIHARLGSARTFTECVLALKALGVERSLRSVNAKRSFSTCATASTPHRCTRSYLADGHSEYC
jgi:hypothetical protein